MMILRRTTIGALLGALMIATSSCGSEIIVPPRETGGSSSSSGGSTSGSSGAGGSPATCIFDDMATWDIEAYDAGGNHPRFAPATSGVPWVALAVEKGNVVLEKLGVGDQGIVVLEQFEIPDSPVYPMAFDANDAYFVMLSTTGNNWNGTLEIWLVDRATGSVMRQPVGNPDNPNYTIRGALGLVDQGIVLGYARPANNEGVVEIRNDKLDVLTTQNVSFSELFGVWRSATAFDVHLSKQQVLEIRSGTMQQKAKTSPQYVIGGLGDYRVDIDGDFRLSTETEAWTAAWPHTQISTPAVVRTFGETAVFSIETELSGVVGYPRNGGLEWLRIESTPGASGIGVVVMPVLEERRIGVFYIALDIPHPEQPLRYFGRICR